MSQSSKRAQREVNGILLLDKPLALSSNQALQRVKRLFKARKAGHTGNLDVLASGLLPVCFGEATKICQFLLDADKRYVAEITFGTSTTTGDAEGEVVRSAPTAGLARDMVLAAMQRFEGWIDQVPPMYSALKHRGMPLYKLARQGKKVERASRRIQVRDFELLKFENPKAVVRVACSKGTYIRTLVEDLGIALGCEGHLSALRRDRVGPFELSCGYDFAQLETYAQRGDDALDGLLIPEDRALGHLPQITLSAENVARIAHGMPVTTSDVPEAGLLRLYDVSQRFLAVGEVLPDRRIAPRRLFRSQASE